MFTTKVDIKGALGYTGTPCNLRDAGFIIAELTKDFLSGIQNAPARSFASSSRGHRLVPIISG
jgi:hypothetical protein